MLNMVCITGRLTRKPELQTSPKGTIYARFCVASTRDYISRETEEREADFPDVIAWRGLGEFVANNFDKGDLITVVGPLRTKMLDRDGNKVKVSTIQADKCYFGSFRRDAGPVAGFDLGEDTGEGAVEEPDEGGCIPEDPSL